MWRRDAGNYVSLDSNIRNRICSPQNCRAARWWRVKIDDCQSIPIFFLIFHKSF
jgi:hypothetical protein